MEIKKVLSSKSANTLTFFNILSPLVLNGINFFTVPIFTRMLGTENYGTTALYTTWVSIFTIIIGLKVDGTIGVANVNFSKEEQKRYDSSVLCISICSFILILALSLIFLDPISRFMQMNKWLILLILFQSFGAFCISYCSSRLIFSKDGAKNFLLSILVSASSVCLSMILILYIGNYSDRYYGKILGTAIPNILFGLIIVIVLLIKGKKLFVAEYWKFCLPLAIPLIFHGLSQTVLAQSDRLVIQHYLTKSDVGIYSLVSAFTSILGVIYSALNTSWVPFYYDFVTQNEIQKIHVKSKNYIFVFTGITVGFLLVSPEVLHVFASADFLSGTNLIPIFVLQAYMTFLYSFPVNFEFYFRQTKLIAIGTCGAAAVNIVLNLCLVPIYGIFGSAVSTMLSYAMLFVFHELIARFIIKHDYHYHIKTFIPGVLIVGTFCVLFYLTQNLWIIRWVLAIVVAFILLKKIVRNKSIF